MKDPLQNMNDEELDMLFRKAAEENAAADNGNEFPAGKEEAWQKLQEKLDAPPPASINDHSSKSKVIWKYLSLLLLLVVGGIVLMQISGKKKERFSSSGSVHQPPILNGRINLTQKNSFDSIKVGPANTVLPSLQPVPRRNRDIAFKSKNISGQDIDYTRMHHRPSINTLPEQSAYWPSIPDHPFVLSSGRIPVKAVLPDSLQYEGGRNLNALETEPAKSGEQGHSSSRKPTDEIPSRWYLGISLGPDWSSVWGEGWGTGFGGGLRLNYQLSKKWIFETGIFATKKIYTAAPYNYNPPGGSSGGYYGYLQSVNANCVLIDIPLNVDYVVWTHGKNSLYIGTGLSSTLMHHEAYTYNIKTNTGGWEQYQKEMYNKERQLFSLWNISAGYEKTWNHFSLEASPYVKIPLSGIGYGRVKLLSTGIQFTFKYGLK